MSKVSEDFKAALRELGPEWLKTSAEKYRELAPMIGSSELSLALAEALLYIAELKEDLEKMAQLGI